MAGELPEDIKATLSILDSQTSPPPAKLKTTRTMEDIALPTKRQPAGGDDVLQTIAILDGKEPEPVATAGEPDPRDIEVDVLKLALRKGINSNTALAAHRQSVARKLNISPALVTPQAEESAFYQDHDPEDLHKNYPALAKYLKVEGNAELVGKNIEPMKELEVFFRRAVQDPEIVAAKGVVGAVQTLVGLGSLVSAGKAGKYVEEHGIDLKKIQSVLNDLYSPEAQAALKSVEEAEGFLGTLTAALKNPSSIGLFVGESLPQMYLGRVFGSGLKAAFPGLSFGAAGAAGEGVTMAGGSAEQIRSVTEDGELTSGQVALSVGVGVAGTALSAFGAKLATKLGIEDVDAALVAGKLLSRLEDSGVPKQLAVRLVGGAAIEGAVEEMPQSVVEQIAQNVALGRTWDEGVPESAALGLVTGGAMGAAVQVGAVRGKQPTVAETPAEKQARTTVQNSILKTAAAVNAEEQRNAIKEWGQRVASGNPLRKEAPDSFKEFVRTMAEEDGALKEVYVDGKLLRESLAQAGIDEDKLKSTMPEVAESLGEALATNGEARIPVEDYATHIVGTPVEQAILDHLRTTPTGMTYAEAQVYFQEQQDDFIKQAEALVNLNEPVLTRKEFAAQAPDGMQYKDYLAAHKNKVEVFAKDLETVHDKLLEGLDSTGRFPKSITRVYAIPFREFYATNAARMGMLPSELYASLPLNFEQMSAGDVLDQRAFHGSPHSFDKFSSEKIGAGEGAQSYGYGLYFTDTKAVAEHYRQAHKNNKLVLADGTDLEEASNGTEERFAQTLLKANSGDYAKSLTENKVEENASAGDKRFSKEVEKILKDYKKRGVKAVSLSGGIYEVELAPEQDEYLLWDKPLSEQSEKVKVALGEIPTIDSVPGRRLAKQLSSNTDTGSAIYNVAFGGYNNPKVASERLHSLGIRGIKYLDGSSRAKGEGAYNYVVFSDEDITITQVYAQSAKMPSETEAERRLVAQHNISVANLIHADRMGGLAAPSLAITDKAHTFDSFGDITLISSKDMIDPRSGAKVFGADIYSPRYPRVDYAFSKDRVVRLNEQLKDQFALTNEKPIEAYDINGDASDAARTLENNAAVMAAFLESKKIKPKLAKVKKKAIPRWALKYADKTMYSYIDTPAFIEDVTKHTEHIDEILSRAENEEERSLMRRRLANSKAYEIDAYRVDRPNFGKIDPKASLSEMNRQIYDKGLHKEYTSYVYNLTLSMDPTERIFKGFTNSGSRKYIPHTIDNVIAELRKNLRGGENFNYGLGSIRARYTPQFKTLEQIRKAEGKLLSSEDFERVKTELDSEFNAVLEELTRYYKHKDSAGFGLYEIGSQALTDAASLGVPRALKENQFENVPQETQNRIADFLAKLADVPAEYFEVKLLRQVGLQEFSGAVVPKNAGQNVIDILKKNGITDIKFYKPQDKADRLAKVNEFSNLFFQSAFYSALQREIPSISKIADKNGMVKTDQAVAWIEARQKEGRFKLEEVEAVGLKDWLQATEGKVSVADIDTFVRENGVQIEEKLLGGVALPVAVQEYEDQPEIYSLYRAGDPEGISYGSLGQIILTGKGEYEINVPEITGKIHYPTLQEALERVSRGAKVFSETKFEQYTLPGGENYRELLLTLPKTEGHDFKSAHYDEKNILAHVRFDDRTNPATGQKILFIEEIQSDWAQEGRKRGFAKPRWTPAEERRVRELEKPRPYPGLTQSERDEYNTLIRKQEEGGTPPAPFVRNTKSWVALAVKRMLRYAAENGYDQIAWTTGGQQAARYDLSKQISEVSALSNGDGTYNLILIDKEDREIAPYRGGGKRLTAIELEDTIGKDLAGKLIKGADASKDKPWPKGAGINPAFYTLKGVDLEVGGEGMVAFYDKLLPQVVNDVAKKLGGGKVGEISIGIPGEQSAAFFVEWAEKRHPGKLRNELYSIWGRGEAEPLVREYLNEKEESTQQSLEITPEMREKILSGLPLFQGQRAGFDPSTFTISLLKGADLSSVIHEGAHFYLEALADLAGRDNAPQQIKDDFRTTLNWFGITGGEEGIPGGATLAQATNIPETINIDGTDRPTRNSEGKLIHPTEEGIRNFWEWFGNDANIDGQGRPKILYHSTLGDINTFRPHGQFMGYSGTSGISLTDNREMASRYLDRYASYGFVDGVPNQPFNKNVMPVYVKIGKFIERTERFATDLALGAPLPEDYIPAHVKLGYDTVIRDDSINRKGATVRHSGAKNALRGKEYIVSNPNQIKSAIGNTGEFSDDPNILKQGGETPPPGQLPPGKTPEEIWRSMTLDQKRRYHEQWAQSYERYTMEGKAPTVEMQSVFSRFREWMLSVYKSMKDFLAQNPLAGKLNDDIRAVFDRLISSEDKIYQAEEARGYSALFGSAAEAGLSEKEFEDYQNLGKLASLRAVDEMNARSIRDMRWLSNAKDKAIKKLQAEANTKRAAIKAQVTDEVDAMPLNRARNFLTRGEFIDEQGVRRESETKFKLNSAEVKALSNGQIPDAVKGMASDDGVGLELAAKLLGYQNPEALLNDLVNGESRDVTIQGLTDQRMLEQYGDLIDDKAIERAAEKAIHNEARAKFMATGLKILAKTELSATQLNRAAKLAAEATIAKKKIRALTPGQFTRAEAKANREAIESVAKDPRKAVEAQRAALLNNRLAKAALEASEEVDSILKYFKKFESQGVRKAVGIDQIDQIDDLLQTVDRDKSLPLREIDKRQALAEWVAEQEADGFEPVLDPILAEQIKAKHYKEMTVDELRMLRDTVKQIEHVGRLKQTLLTEMRRADFRERVEEAEASIRDNANRTVKERGTPTDVAGITGQWVRQMIASHRKFSSYMREMDGGKDGGVMWRLLSKSMNAAGDQEIEMRRASGEAIAELFKGFKQEKAPLNLYAKRTQIPGTEIFMTQEQRIMFGMNWGNEGNRQRLLDGGITGKRALSITEAQAILDTLTKEEWDFIQGTWDHIATYKDQIAALERKLTGIEPEWIEPAEIKTKYGTYRGGYFPAKYDVELSSRSESLEAAVDLRMGMKGAFNTAATRNGYTKQRSEAVMNRPLLLSYNVIANHISEVTHRLAWQPWLIDANRILKALDAPIREHYGAEVLRELRNTVIDIAAGDIGARTPMERAINHLRTGSTIVGMGWRFSTAFLQPSGLAQSWARIGGRWVAKGIAESLKNPNKAGEFVNVRSSLMKNRDITMNREVREVLDRIRTTESVNAVTGSYFSLIAKMQRMVDIPTWMGAYEKALHDLKYEDAGDAEQRARIEHDAVALADQAVVDSQSGGQIKDLASIQRGHPGLKLFTNFYSYFSATYNLNIEALRRTNFRSPTDVAFLASDLVLLNVLPVIFAVALKEMTKGKCGDDMECLAASYGYEQMGFMFGQMVLLRDAGSAALVAAGGDQFGYSGPAGLRFFSDLYKAGVQTNQGELDWPLFKSVSNTAGVLLHFPTGQINTTLEGIIAVENGDVDGVSILPALLFGPPKE